MTITQKTPDQVRNMREQFAAIIEKGFLRPSDLLSFLLDTMHGLAKLGYSNDHATAQSLINLVYTQWLTNPIDTVFEKMPDTDFLNLIDPANLYSLGVAAITTIHKEADESLPRHYQYIQSLGYVSALFELSGVNCDNKAPQYYQFPPIHKAA